MTRGDWLCVLVWPALGIGLAVSLLVTVLTGSLLGLLVYIPWLVIMTALWTENHRDR